MDTVARLNGTLVDSLRARATINAKLYLVRVESFTVSSVPFQALHKHTPLSTCCPAEQL